MRKDMMTNRREFLRLSAVAAYKVSASNPSAAFETLPAELMPAMEKITATAVIIVTILFILIVSSNLKR